MTASISSLRLVLALALAALALAALTPAIARAQQPTAPRVRRTVEIRAQAPAPEVITVRPRDVPQYTRRLLVPALLTPADTTSVVRAAVVVPAPASAEARAAAASDRRTRTP